MTTWVLFFWFASSTSSNMESQTINGLKSLDACNQAAVSIKESMVHYVRGMGHRCIEVFTK